jgi:hypothetical protein
MRVGVEREVVVPSPSCPKRLSPQHHRELSVLTAQVCPPSVDTSRQSLAAAVVDAAVLDADAAGPASPSAAPSTAQTTSPSRKRAPRKRAGLSSGLMRRMEDSLSRLR